MMRGLQAARKEPRTGPMIHPPVSAPHDGDHAVTDGADHERHPGPGSECDADPADEVVWGTQPEATRPPTDAVRAGADRVSGYSLVLFIVQSLPVVPAVIPPVILFAVLNNYFGVGGIGGLFAGR